MADLIDYKKHQMFNRPYRYILVVIDCFSRFAWTRPLKSKTAEESANALDSILTEIPFKPRFFASDQGNEFSILNKSLKKILIDKFRMKVYTLKGQTKSSIVERWNRTFKELSKFKFRLIRKFYLTLKRQELNVTLQQ